MSPTAAEHLKDEVKRALHLLHDLTEHNPPAEPLGKLQPALVKHCKGLFFYHTKKVGLGVGLKWGAGVLVTHLVDEQGRSGWSAPALYKVKEAALGLIAGAGSIQTLVVLGSGAAVNQFQQATLGPVVLGQDLSLGKALGFGVMEDINLLSKRDVVTLSTSGGAIVDWSIIGGKISFDKEANAEIYGAATTAQQILGAPASTHSPPEALRPLYAALEELAGAADGDARRFGGFHSSWRQQMADELHITRRRDKAQA
ncbi:hypothetical protein WJX81_002242 [Elliptochloris bilobata]|uniref:Ysc84 actin-binding domain-containing protein n=1 Tax=Elliptochloris bilobata TaxID=381761 RepID=A0AAW1SBR0_9CHLO